MGTIVADLLRPWVTIDVFCLASLIFLFTVQDIHTLTTPTDGWAFYLFLGAGFSFFFLRWFPEGTEEEVRRLGELPSNKFWILIGSYLLLCLFILCGVPGSTPVFDFPTLDSVCLNMMPLMNKTVRAKLPATYGDCTNHPELMSSPCKSNGGGPLYTTNDSNGFITASWISGINTMMLDSCHLWSGPVKDDTGDGAPFKRYHLTVGGEFSKMKVYLKMKQCNLLTCERMDSADHCCGDDVRFQATFGLDCTPGLGLNAFKKLALEDFQIQKLQVQASMFDGFVEVSGFDIAAIISPMIEKAVQGQVADFLSTAHLEWAHKDLNVPQLLNRLVYYNSPDEVC